MSMPKGVASFRSSAGAGFGDQSASHQLVDNAVQVSRRNVDIGSLRGPYCCGDDVNDDRVLGP